MSEEIKNKSEEVKVKVKEKRERKIKKSKREIIIKAVALLMAILMVFTIAATVIFYLQYYVFSK